MNKLVYLYIYIWSSMVGHLFLSLSCLHVFVHGLDFVCLGILDICRCDYRLFYCMLEFFIFFFISFDEYMREVFVPYFLP